MFMMIGGDGREYGPVTADELRAWITDGRANGQTPVRAQGDTEWHPLSTYPEFADALRVAGVVVSPPSPTPPTGPTDEVAARFDEDDLGNDLDVSDCLGRGWMLLVNHFFLIAAAVLLVWGIQLAGAFATCVGGFVAIVIAGALHGGLMILCLNLIRDRPASLRDVFSCFGASFLNLMLVWIFTHVVSGIGFFFCILPGIYLKVIWAFGLPLAADRGIPMWPALEISRKVVQRHFLKITGLLTLAFMPMIVFEIYSSIRASMFVFEWMGPIGAWKWDQWDQLQPRVLELAQFLTKLELQRQIVILLNLPFAYAALTCAYEAIFGKRPRA